MSDIEAADFNLEGLPEIDPLAANQIAVFGLNRLIEDMMIDPATHQQAELVAIKIATTYGRLRQAGQGNKWQPVKLIDRRRGPEVLALGKHTEVRGLKDYFEFYLPSGRRPQMRHISEDIFIELGSEIPAHTKRTITTGGPVRYRQAYAWKRSTINELVLAEQLLRRF